MTVDLARLKKVINQPELKFLGQINNELPNAEWYLVGGAVRDALLGRLENEKRDIDLVVRNVGLDEVSEVLEKMGKIDYVGRDFGVLKFLRFNHLPNEKPIDIAWPRTEVSIGTGSRRDFEVHANPDLPIADDLARRDFTINAMAWDFKRSELIDFFDGLADVEAGLIRVVGNGEKRFKEDFSRMLRAIRFACELDFEIENNTWETLLRLARHINDARQTSDGEMEMVVPRETVAKEWLKSLISNATRTLDYYERSGLLFELIPELRQLDGLKQSPDWHSEGDVWTHTKLAIAVAQSDKFKDFFGETKPTAETLIAVLFHDIGKADTMEIVDDNITFHGHDVVGADIAKKIVERLRLSSAGVEQIRVERIEYLVRMHMFPLLVDLDHVRKTVLEKYLLNDKEAGNQLLQVAYCDLSASIKENGETDLSNLVKLKQELECIKEKIGQDGKPLLTGRDVMEQADIDPGPLVGKLLEEIREEQLSGKILTDEEAKELVRKMIEK